SEFKDRWEKEHKSGLSVQQAVIKAVLADERLTGATSQMSSIKIIDENTAVARDAKPLAAADHDLLMRLYAKGPHRLCERCNGACASAIGRPTALHDVARFIMYHEVYGLRGLARKRYLALPRHELELSDDELSAATAACGDGLDYTAIFARARRL